MTCECGCGGTPKGAASRWLPGHDWRRPRPVVRQQAPEQEGVDETAPSEFQRTLSMLGRLVYNGIGVAAEEEGADD